MSRNRFKRRSGHSDEDSDLEDVRVHPGTSICRLFRSYSSFSWIERRQQERALSSELSDSRADRPGCQHLRIQSGSSELGLSWLRTDSDHEELFLH